MPDNVVQIVGNLTRDPELRFTPNGQAVCNFGIASTRVWTDKQSQERKEVTGFFDVVAWGPSAQNIAESFCKGSRVIVLGTLEYHSWELDDGSKRSKVEIKADDVGASTRWATVVITRNEKENYAAKYTPQPTPQPTPQAAGWAPEEDF